MSLSHETLLELMSLADGELEGSDKERVERLVASDDEARQIVASLRGAEVGTWLAETMDQRAAASGADGIADAVMAAVAAGSSSRASAAPNGVARGAVAAIAPARARKSSRFQVIAGGATAVLALAAAVAIYMRAGTGPLDEHAPVASVGVPPVDVEAPSSMAMTQQGAGGGVEVNEIDAPQRGVSVFEIPVGAAAAVATPTSASSVVVWVDDDPGSK
jgi:anti-sigma factor RsiW